MPLSFKNVSDRSLILPELKLWLDKNEEVTLRKVNLYNFESVVFYLRTGKLEITHPALAEFFAKIEWNELS